MTNQNKNPEDMTIGEFEAYYQRIRQKILRKAQTQEHYEPKVYMCEEWANAICGYVLEGMKPLEAVDKVADESLGEVCYEDLHNAYSKRKYYFIDKTVDWLHTHPMFKTLVEEKFIFKKDIKSFEVLSSLIAYLRNRLASRQWQLSTKVTLEDRVKMLESTVAKHNVEIDTILNNNRKLTDKVITKLTEITMKGLSREQTADKKKQIALSLLDAGVPDNEILKYLSITDRTLRRYKEQ